MRFKKCASCNLYLLPRTIYVVFVKMYMHFILFAPQFCRFGFQLKILFNVFLNILLFVCIVASSAKNKNNNNSGKEADR